MIELSGNHSFHAELKCTECSKIFPIHKVIYRCDSCNGLLEVSHDTDKLKEVPADEWKSLFESRYRSSRHPYTSGIWGKREWVLPQIKSEHIVTLGEGATPLVNVKQFAKELNLKSVHVKQCGVSHTGSFKDLGMTVLVSHVVSLKSQGVSIRAVACASTGDTSAALSAYAAAAEIPSVVFLPSGKISTAQLVQPISNGALVLSLDTDFDGCMEIVKQVTEDRSLYLANSMNPLRIEGQKSISVELVQQLGWSVPDWVVIPGGNLGNVSALASGFIMLRDTGIIDRVPRLILAQAANANPMYLSYKSNFKLFEPVSAKRTLASAIQIGNPVSYPRAKRALQSFDGVVEQATEDELSNAAARVDRYGMFTDPHTGVALASLIKLTDAGVVKKGESVVVISTAHALKFSEFKTGYHQEKLEGVASKFANSPVALPADVDAVKRALKELLG